MFCAEKYLQAYRQYVESILQTERWRLGAFRLRSLRYLQQIAGEISGPASMLCRAGTRVEFKNIHQAMGR